MKNTQIKYPNIIIRLTQNEEDAIIILRRVLQALVEAKVPLEQIRECFNQMISSDYINLVETAFNWVTII